MSSVADARGRGSLHGQALPYNSPFPRRSRPAWLASPLFEGELGDAVRIDWNGRFRSSIGGSNRSYFYEEHTMWVTLQAAPTDSTFLTLAPSKHIDLRTTIY